MTEPTGEHGLARSGDGSVSAAKMPWHVVERLRHYEWCVSEHPDDQPCPRPRRPGRVLSLCDLSGVMVEPWFRAGYDCTIVDLQHPDQSTAEVVNATDGVLRRVHADVTKWLPPMGEYAIVFAFPPCTHLAVSGARWWAGKGLDALIEALTVVNACRKICEQTGAPYLIENPVGALSTHWRKPDHAFDPLDFGAYVLDGEDFTKRTHLWTGGGFVMPEKRPLPMSEENNPIHWAGESKDRANVRSLTPRGFAQAVFEANDPARTLREVAS